MSKPFRRTLGQSEVSKKLNSSLKKSSRLPLKNKGQRQIQDSDKISTKHLRAVVGKHAIAEALRISSHKVKLVYLRSGWESSHELRELAEELKKYRIQFDVRPHGFFDQYYSSAQGAVLFLEGRPEFSLESLDSKTKSTLLFLDGLEDPHNLGAILRTAWLMGVDAVVTTTDGAVGLSPSVHKVACGGVEHVPVVELSNFSTLANELKKRGYWFFGLSHKAKSTLLNTQLQDKIVWVIGSEEKGLRSTTEKLCEELVSIPQVSPHASYNASVATGMALILTLR